MELSQAEKVMQKIHDRQARILEKLAKNYKGIKPFNKEQIAPRELINDQNLGR